MFGMFGTPSMEGCCIIALVCHVEEERPGLKLGILGMRGLAVPGGEAGVVGGDGLDAQDGLPGVAAESLSGRLSCSPCRILSHLCTRL